MTFLAAAVDVVAGAGPGRRTQREDMAQALWAGKQIEHGAEGMVAGPVADPNYRHVGH